jgi:hypothetical protein
LWFVNVHVHNAEADAVIQHIADAELVTVQPDGVPLQRIHLRSYDRDDTIDVRCHHKALNPLGGIVRDGNGVFSFRRNKPEAYACIASRYIDA